MSPLKSEEFVQPRVKTPPGAIEVSLTGLRLRDSQINISGLVRRQSIALAESAYRMQDTKHYQSRS